MKSLKHAILLVVGLLTTGALAAYAEESPRPRFRLGESVSFGAKAGLSISHFRGEGVDVLDDQLRAEFPELADDPLPFVMGGLFVTLALSENFALQPEIMYQRNGKKFEGGAMGETFDFDLHVDYLTFPILFKVMAPSPEMLFRPNFFFGPVVSVALAARAENVPELPSEIGDMGLLKRFRDDEDIADHTRSLDLGVAIGAGIDAKAGPGHFTFEFRYSAGFLDVFDDDRNAEEIKNAAVAILAGYAYDF
ncbi:MAG: outer membrane beta-barrel protein [Chitinivibrionales bacterium]|nr:outer membrane beta-barrel protein [Chitinivibrionales bacterium]MBD3357947.1 outer membrane beta-barrel protein [Chitinivibrionales bacterium]